jgi:hypothetical protein
MSRMLENIYKDEHFKDPYEETYGNLLLPVSYIRMQFKVHWESQLLQAFINTPCKISTYL